MTAIFIKFGDVAVDYNAGVGAPKKVIIRVLTFEVSQPI